MMRAFLVMLVALAALALPAAAQVSPEAFLQSIYSQYDGADGPPLDGAAMQAYFTPDLAALIRTDSEDAAKRGDMPLLNGDPFIDAQDWKIENLKIVAEETRPGAAKATVTFLNFGEPFEIRLDLERLPEGWRIGEIYAPSGALRELLTK